MHEFEPGMVFAGHRIDELAGRGGMGVVYRALQLELSRTVALKVIAPALVDDPGVRRRFVRESRLAASIEHPNVIPIHYVGENEGIAYIAMRFVPGDDLRTLVRREGALPPARAARIVAQVAAALDAAHVAGLVHRDVKPANVLLGPADHAYLTDFGLTTGLESRGTTSTGRWVGTLDYVAPEQIRGERVDARTDVYSLGAMLYYTLTQRVPFAHEGEEAKLWAHLNEPPPSVAAWGAPAAFEPVIARAMAKAPADRYPSAGDLGRAAEAAVTGRRVTDAERSVASGRAAPSETRPATVATRRDPSDAPTRASAAEPDAGRRPRRRLAAAAGAFVVLAGAAAAFALTRPDEEPAAPVRSGEPAPRPAPPRVVEAYRGVQRPSSIAHASGRLWVGSARRPPLSWIDLGAGERLRRARGVDGGVRHMAASAGRLWLTQAAERRLVELDGATGRTAGEPIPLSGVPSALAAHAQTVWVGLKGTPEGEPPRLATIDADSGDVRATIPWEQEIGGLELARGSLWVLAGEPARLLRVDRRSGAVERTFQLPGEDPAAIDAGAGAVWVTLHDHNSVARVDPASGSSAAIAVGARPVGVAAHRDTVWVANLGSSTVSRLDRRGRVEQEVQVPLNPYAVAADDRGAWVTTVGESRVVRIAG
jgi:streptogramin lyase